MDHHSHLLLANSFPELINLDAEVAFVVKLYMYLLIQKTISNSWYQTPASSKKYTPIRITGLLEFF